ncbi:hypothetical protein EDB83DRAFT_2580073 [Lactarius deliciosus]|nr:hypothetical protein EDB83DRAFT_2580073 [Lactarius deliciosus]
MEETRGGIVRQNMVREYMIARNESFKESTILSAWEKSGIRPLNPGIFTKDDYGPSYATSINPPLPDSFPVLATAASQLDPPPDEANGDGNEESNKDEDEDNEDGSDGKVQVRTSVQTRTYPNRTLVQGSGSGVDPNRTDGSVRGSAKP